MYMYSCILEYFLFFCNLDLNTYAQIDSKKPNLRHYKL